MKISASIQSKYKQHDIIVKTNDSKKGITIPPKSSGFGSSVNGGELLMLSLATCFCNDIYREADKRNIKITAVDVECSGDFGAEGEPGSSVSYKVNIVSDASLSEIEELVKHTDKVAEIHNTLRKGVAVRLTS